MGFDPFVENLWHDENLINIIAENYPDTVESLAESPLKIVGSKVMTVTATAKPVHRDEWIHTLLSGE